MNGVSAASGYRGLPATRVICLSPQRQMDVESPRRAGGETVLAAVAYPPRGGEPRSLGALVPEVLARYGLSQELRANPAVDLVA
jgi:hypothetical protein